MSALSKLVFTCFLTASLTVMPVFSPAFARTDSRLDIPTPATRPASLFVLPKPDLGVFRSVALPVGRLSSFADWEKASLIADPDQSCWMGLCRSRTGRQLAAAVRQARGMAPKAALDLINRKVNALIAYRADAGDHWASLTETALRGAGDCEDYALAKRALLVGAGFDESQIQFIVLKETRRQIYHAVIAVHIAGTRYILDNLSNAVMPDSVYRSYLPVVSFAEGKTYLHGFADSRAQLARGTDFRTLAPGDGQ